MSLNRYPQPGTYRGFVLLAILVWFLTEFSAATVLDACDRDLVELVQNLEGLGSAEIRLLDLANELVSFSEELSRIPRSPDFPASFTASMKRLQAQPAKADPLPRHPELRAAADEILAGLASDDFQRTHQAVEAMYFLVLHALSDVGAVREPGRSLLNLTLANWGLQQAIRTRHLEKFQLNLVLTGEALRRLRSMAVPELTPTLASMSELQTRLLEINPPPDPFSEAVLTDFGALKAAIQTLPRRFRER